MHRKIVVIGGLVVFLALGYWFEQHDGLSALKRASRKQEVPTAMLSYGPMGKILAYMGNVNSVKNLDSAKQKPLSEMDEIRANVFQRKRQIRDFDFRANIKGYAGFPSSQILKTDDLKPEWPVISIVMDPDDLFGEEKGIVSNFQNFGRDWERLCSLSYYEDQKLLFAANGGIRVQGRTRRGHGINSFRIYFRREYGTPHFKEGILFGPECDPVRTLVIREDSEFNCLLAYDITEHLGARAPGHKEALLYVNGEYHGICCLSEHLKRRQWLSHIGNDNFYFKRFTADSDPESDTAYINTWRWANSSPGKMTVYEAWKYVDLDNLSRHILSYAFCGSYHSYQNAMCQDNNTPGGRWYWINWDMDPTFDWGNEYFPKSWEQFTYETIMSNDEFFPVPRSRDYSYGKPNKVLPVSMSSRNPDLRSILFFRLWKEDLDYRKQFALLAQDALNHLLNPAYLQSRVKYYQSLADAVPGEEFPERYKEFVENRPAFLRLQTAKYFGLGESTLCVVKGPEGIECQIDGYEESLNYQGWYFKGQTITVEVTDPKANLQHWLVNGQKVETQRLEWPVHTETIIEFIGGQTNPNS